MGSLFRDGIRTDLRRDRRETVFGFLDRSGKPECENARVTLNKWFDALDESHRPEVLARLRTDRDIFGVVAELYADSLFRELGFDVQYQPDFGTRSKPDLRVEVEGVGPIAVDVTIENGVASVNAADARIEKVLADVEERLSLKGFVFMVREVVSTARNPSTKRLAAIIQDFASSIRWSTLPDPTSELLEQVIEEPDSGWEISLAVYRFNIEDEVAPRAFASRMHSAGWGGSFEFLRTKLAAKVSQHAGIGVPLIVFVAYNDLGTRPSRPELQSVLYGTTYDESQAGEASIVTRNVDGLWKPGKHTPLAVVSLNGLLPWTLERREQLTLWNSPTGDLGELGRRWPFFYEEVPSNFGTRLRPRTRAADESP